MATVFADNYGFNGEDATNALRAAINDPNADKIIVRNMGKPWLISETITIAKSNKEIVFEPGVLVQAKSGSFLDNTRPMIRVLSAENIKFIGQGEGENQATLKMNKEEYKSSEFGHILDINGAKDYVVSGLKLTGAGGDGIHVSGAAYQTPEPGLRSYSENGLIENIISDNNRRQGISIDSAKDLIVRNSKFINTSGTAPSAGIDLEPTWSFESLQNVKIENVDVLNNNGNGILIPLGNLDEQSEPVSIEIDGARISNSNRSSIAIEIYNLKDKGSKGNDPNSMVDGTVNIRNTSISDSNGTYGDFEGDLSAGISVKSLPGNQDDPNNLKVNFEKVDISGTKNGEFIKNPIYIRGYGGDSAPQQVGNLSFKDVTVQDAFDRDIIRAELGRPDGYLNNISGNITASNPNGVTSSFDFDTQPQNFSLTVSEGNTSSSSSAENPPSDAADPILGTVQSANPNLDDMLAGWDSWSDQVILAENADQDPWGKVDTLGGSLGQDVMANIVAGQDYITCGTNEFLHLEDQADLGVLSQSAASKIQDAKALPIIQDAEESLQLNPQPWQSWWITSTNFQ
jgi:Right handed beta helix region